MRTIARPTAEATSSVYRCDPRRCVRGHVLSRAKCLVRRHSGVPGGAGNSCRSKRAGITLTEIVDASARIAIDVSPVIRIAGLPEKSVSSSHVGRISSSASIGL